MTLKGYMDVIARTTFHLQAGTEEEPMTKPKPGSTESLPTPGRDQPRKHVHTDSMDFNEFHLSIDEFHLNRVSIQGLVVVLVAVVVFR